MNLLALYFGKCRTRLKQCARQRIHGCAGYSALGGFARATDPATALTGTPVCWFFWSQYDPPTRQKMELRPCPRRFLYNFDVSHTLTVVARQGPDATY